MTGNDTIDNAVSMGQILEFEVAFPNELPLSVEEYLAGGSKSLILNTAAFLLGFKNQGSEFADNKRFVSMFFRDENAAFANEILYRIREFEKQGVKIGIINKYTSLKLFERFFSIPQDQETQTEAEFERNMFKAYLVLNSEFTKEQDTATSSCEEIADTDLKPAMILFCMQYPLSDKTNYDIKEIWTTQIIKAIYLFEFLETHEDTKALLAAFLSYFNCASWQQYLKNLLPLTTPAIENEREGHIDVHVSRGDNFKENCAFIEKLIVEEDDALDKNDFLTVRSKPFYKLSEGIYRIIFNLFVVEKIFKGVYFLLRDVNKMLPPEEKIKEIRSFYGEEFSEKILCYKVLKTIYPGKCVCFSGAELAAKKIDGAPDYYLRKGKNIILFESKDFLILAEKKASFDYAIYEAEFKRVLYYEELPNGNEKHKAVMQLINSIRKILNHDFVADIDYRYKDVFIYPVLLTHDHQYDIPGFNELVNYWFQEELLGLKKDGLFIYHVKPLAVVNIDSLINHQVALANDILLHEVLKEYHQYKSEIYKTPKIKTRQDYEKYLDDFKRYKMSRLLPFSLFIDRYFYKRGLWKLPPVLDLVKPTLFKEDLEKEIV